MKDCNSGIVTLKGVPVASTRVKDCSKGSNSGVEPPVELWLDMVCGLVGVRKQVKFSFVGLDADTFEACRY